MNIHVVVFLIGLFLVPLVLLAFGHRIRRRGPRQRALFWGAIVGHCFAVILAVVLGMIPPEEWTSSETTRGFAGLWSLLVFPIVGALIAAVLRRPRGGDAQSVRR
jgi:MFS family permease